VCADTFVLQAVLGANIDFQGHKLKDKVKPYVVKQVKGKKVGVQLHVVIDCAVCAEQLGSSNVCRKWLLPAVVVPCLNLACPRRCASLA
jgi:hypothetical protein